MSSDLNWRQLIGPVARAEDAVSRLDERLRTSPHREGWINRINYQDALAALFNEGDLLQQEDLVLHDHHMDVRMPTPELERAQGILSARRKVAERPSRETLTFSGVRAIVGAWKGRAPSLEDIPAPVQSTSQTVMDILAFADALEQDATLPKTPHQAPAAPDERDEIFDMWLDKLRDVQTLPPTLGATLLVQSWADLDPIPRQAWVGRLLAGAYLKRERLSFLVPMHLGRKLFRRQNGLRRTKETVFDILSQIDIAAHEGLALHDKLVHAHAVLQLHLEGRRSSSRMKDVVDLFIAQPLVTIPMVSKQVGVTERAATMLIDEIRSSVREITGRKSYRAWAIAS